MALMLSQETGPWGIFERLRNFPKEGSYLRKGIGCILCESVWWSAVLSLWFVLAGVVSPAIAPVFWLAVSGSSIIINAQWPYKD